MSSIAAGITVYNNSSFPCQCLTVGCGSFMKAETVSTLKLIIQMYIHGKFTDMSSKWAAAIERSEETLQQEV